MQIHQMKLTVIKGRILIKSAINTLEKAHT